MAPELKPVLRLVFRQIAVFPNPGGKMGLCWDLLGGWNVSLQRDVLRRGF